MTDAEADRLAVLIQARWPYPEFTQVDLVVWRQDLRSIAYHLAAEALNAMAAEGRERQPRSPQLLEAVARLREQQEGRPVAGLSPDAQAAQAAALAAAQPPAGWVPSGRRGPLAALVDRAVPR
jgi:hypothetical protein